MESLRTWEFDHNSKGKNPVDSTSVNLVEGDESKNSNKSKNKRKFKGGNEKSSNKKPKRVCWKCGNPRHFKKDCRVRKVNKGVGLSGSKEAGPSGSKDIGKQQGQNYDLV